VHALHSHRQAREQHRTKIKITHDPRSHRTRFTKSSRSTTVFAPEPFPGQSRSWRIHLRTGLTFGQLARAINPVVRGWLNYYGSFYRTGLHALLHRINAYLVRWIQRKYRRFGRFKKAKACWKRITKQYPRMFAHWAWTSTFWGMRTTRAR